MILFHFTCREHLPSILAEGVLRTTESNMSPRRAHAGPDVVWLMTASDPTAHGHGLEGSGADKKAIRFTVDVDKRGVHKWREWAIRRGINREWLTILARFGGSSSWRVVERPIPREQWVSVRDMVTGRSILADSLRTDEASK